MTVTWKNAVLAVAIAPLALTAACGDTTGNDPSAATTDEATQTLASALGSDGKLSQFREAIDSSELSTVFDGPASYTLLAPDNAAFSALGEEGTSLMQEEQRPILVAVLREHMLPGHLTLEAIGEAIDRAGGSVKMTTLGENPVSFSRDGDAIVFSAANGSSARVSGTPASTSNGVVIPIDTVLMPAQQGS